MTGRLHLSARPAPHIERDMAQIAVEWSAMRPFGGFDFIMADPPWAFRLHSDRGDRKSPQAKYECQGLGWIEALPVDALAADNCLLWMWATNPMIREGLRVVEAWGFTFKTMGAWVKRTVTGKEAYGTGYLLRSSSEPFILASRGRPPLGIFDASAGKVRKAPGVGGGVVRSVIVTQDAGTDPLASLGITIEAVTREHSRKPDEAYEAARILMPDAKRTDLFAREARPGFTPWGNEVDKFEGAL